MNQKGFIPTITVVFLLAIGLSFYLGTKSQSLFNLSKKITPNKTISSPTPTPKPLETPRPTTSVHLLNMKAILGKCSH